MKSRSEPPNRCCVCDSNMVLVIFGIVLVVALVVALVVSLLFRVGCPAEHEQVRSLNKDVTKLEKENEDFKKENSRLTRLCQEREIDTQVCLTKENEGWQFWWLATILAFVVGTGCPSVSRCCLRLYLYQRQTRAVVVYKDN